MNLLTCSPQQGRKSRCQQDRRRQSPSALSARCMSQYMSDQLKLIQKPIFFINWFSHLKDEDANWETVNGQDDKLLAEKQWDKMYIHLGMKNTHAKPNLEAFCQWACQTREKSIKTMKNVTKNRDKRPVNVSESDRTLVWGMRALLVWCDGDQQTSLRWNFYEQDYATTGPGQRWNKPFVACCGDDVI